MVIPVSLTCKSLLPNNLILSIKIFVDLLNQVSIRSSMTHDALVQIFTFFQALIVEPMLLEENNDIIPRDHSNAISTTVNHWEPMMASIAQSFLNIFECLNAFKGHQVSCHQILCNDLLAGSWNLVKQDRHLFASACSLVKRSCKQSSNLVGNNNGEDDRNEK